MADVNDDTSAPAVNSDPAEHANESGKTQNGCSTESPRAYQLEMLEQAKKRNVIACLKTGAGKTLIAKLLIEHVLQQGGPGTKAVLIVHRVPLATQHEDYLRERLGEEKRISCFHGGTGVDYWEPETWIKRIENLDVAVMTAQVLLNGLRHALVKRDTFKLWIFDECHHATKDHPFNNIMQEFYHQATDIAKRPKILGLTATPIKLKQPYFEDDDEFGEELQGLEDNLDADVIVMSKDTRKELEETVPNAEEFLSFYEPAKKVVDSNTGSIEQREARLKARKDRLQKAEERLLRAGMIGDPKGGIASGGDSKADKLQEDIKIVCEYVEEQLGSLAAESLETHLAHGGSLEDKSDVNGQLSDKVCKLLSLLCKERNRWQSLGVQSQFHCIVFVERRCIAWVLSRLINWSIPQLTGNLETVGTDLRAEFMMASGIRSLVEPKTRMTVSRMKIMIQQFRDHHFGIFCSTGVLEEGIDVQSCGLVIMFDAPRSMPSYVQSRGRARHAHSHYVIFIPRYGVEFIRMKEELNAMRTALSRIESVVSFNRSSRSARRKLKDSTPNATQKHCLISEKTGARVPLCAAVNLVVRYCELLPRDVYCDKRSRRPRFQVSMLSPKSYTCTVKLPLDAAVQEGSCQESMLSKKDAKARVALEVYRQLYEKGVVNEHLLPVGCSRRLEAEDTLEDNFIDEIYNGRESLSSSSVYMPKLPVWREGAACTVYLYLIIHERASAGHHHGILTPKMIDDDDLCALSFPSGDRLFELRYIRSLSLTKPQYESAVEFARRIRAITINSVHKLLRGMYFIEKPGYLFVPLKPSSNSSKSYEIGWEMVEALAYYDFKSCDWPGECQFINLGTMEHAVVQSRHDEKPRIYFTLGRKTDLTPVSSSVNILSKELSKDFPTFYEYFTVRFETPIQDKTQLMVEAYHKCRWESGNRAFFLVPELCRVVPVDKHTVAIAQLLPSWHCYICVKECYRHFSPVLRIPDVIQFSRVVTPRAVSQNPNHNYERWEFLGDAVLKFLVSLYLFRDQPMQHEGALTYLRNARISNDTLRSISISHHIDQTLAHSSSPRTLNGCKFYLAPQYAEYTPSRKRLADIVEALIGFDFVCNGLESASGFLKHLKLTKEVSNQTSGSGAHDFDDKTRLRISEEAEPIEKLLRYSFVNKLLVVEALTHPSVSSPVVKTNSYQRLEFLGDAVLSHIIADYLFRKYKTFTPGELSLVRQVAVSNDLFARASVRLSLHEHIFYRSKQLGCDLKAAVDVIKSKKDDSLFLETVDCPKVLGDIFESTVGAIVADLGSLDLGEIVSKIWELFREHLTHLFEKYCNPSKTLQHPILKCQLMLEQHFGVLPKYEVKRISTGDVSRSRIGEVEKGKTMARMWVGDKKLGEATGINREHARRLAAEQVLNREISEVGAQLEIADRTTAKARAESDDETDLV